MVVAVLDDPLALLGALRIKFQHTVQLDAPTAAQRAEVRAPPVPLPPAPASGSAQVLEWSAARVRASEDVAHASAALAERCTGYSRTDLQHLMDEALLRAAARAGDGVCARVPLGGTHYSAPPQRRMSACRRATLPRR
jgi:hypothetical protein